MQFSWLFWAWYQNPCSYTALQGTVLVKTLQLSPVMLHHPRPPKGMGFPMTGALPILAQWNWRHRVELIVWDEAGVSPCMLQ